LGKKWAPPKRPGGLSISFLGYPITTSRREGEAEREERDQSPSSPLARANDRNISKSLDKQLPPTTHPHLRLLYYLKRFYPSEGSDFIISAFPSLFLWSDL